MRRRISQHPCGGRRLVLVPQQVEETPVSIQDRFEPDEEERGEEAQGQVLSLELSEFRG